MLEVLPGIVPIEARREKQRLQPGMTVQVV
jgi:hypothetical protein